MRCSYSATFMGVSVKKGFLNILMCWDLQWLREKKAFYSLSALGFREGQVLGAKRKLPRGEAPSDLSLAMGRGPSPLCMQL